MRIIRPTPPDRSARRFITHDEGSTVYWSSRKLAERHICLMLEHGKAVDLYQELEPWQFGPGIRIVA